MSLRESLVTDLRDKLGEASENLSIANDPIKWIEKEFYIPETRQDPKLRGRMILQDYQRDVLHELLDKDEHGNYKYSIVVWSDIKKSIKSTIAAAVNLARAHTTDWGEFFVIANDLKQADSRVAHYMRRAIELNPKLKKVYTTRGYRITAPNGSFIEAIPIDPSGEAGTNADQITFSELWGANEGAKQRMWCLDEESEILTRSGWKKGVELTTEDEVAVYRNDGMVFWDKPKSVFINHYKGVMHLYEHRNFSLMCTPDHRLYGRFSRNGHKRGIDKYEKEGVLTSKELRNTGFSYYHPEVRVNSVAWHLPPDPIYIKSTKFKPSLTIPYTKWALFLGLYLSDGSTADFRGVPCNVRISQVKSAHPEKYEYIYSILKDIFGEWAKKQKYDGFKISSTELAKITKPFGTTFEKRVPRELIESNPTILKNFLDGFILGDGYIADNGSIQITCATKELANDLQEIAFRLGKKTSVRPHSDGYWRVYISSEKTGTVVQKHRWSEVQYNGLVWCPTVSTGLFIARREGRPFVTGNSEMTIPPQKHGKSFRMVESYAGFADESELLYNLYDLGVKKGELLWPDRLYPVTEGVPTPLEVFVNREARMLCMWNTYPRNPWQTQDYYKSEATILHPNEFQRMHRNQWVSSTETFVPMEWFHACRRDEADWPQWKKKEGHIKAYDRPFTKENWPVIITLDAAVSGAAFGLYMGCRHPEFSDEILTLYAQKWMPGGHDGKIDYYGTEENPGPDKVLRKLISLYNVVEVAYDEFQLHSFCSTLKQDGLTVFRVFPQGNERLVADSLLRDMIRERRFWHRGEKDLEEHIQNADAKIDPEDRKIRIVKRAERLHVDLAVCASMCCRELMRLNL